ncbi:MAG: kelch repeat-containing protein [Planctomycetota bacterium]
MARDRTVLVALTSGYPPAFPVSTWLWDGANWTSTSATTPRFHDIAYDAVRQRVLGVARIGGAETTWEWDGTSWTDLGIATPGIQAMAHDTTRQRTVGLSSGFDSTDVWEFDGNSWVQATATALPLRAGPAMAYDAARGEVTVFGGTVVTSLLSTAPNRDTRLWNGTRWAIPANIAPSFRRDHAMIYDTARDCALLFGGFGEGLWWNDLWSWDGAIWTEIQTATKPVARRAHALTYDSVRDRVVLFGGRTTTPLDDTWEWDGSAWQERVTATRPPAGQHAMAFDQARGRTVLVTAGATNETWEWDGASWALRTQGGPSGLLGARMAYDPRRQTMVLFGADAGLTAAATWVWDGSVWSQQTPTQSPPPLSGHAMCYDRSRDRIIIMGGYAPTPYYGRGQTAATWEWDGSTWVETDDFTVGLDARVHAAMVYDEARQTALLYGGLYDLDPGRTIDNVILGDTWNYGAVVPATYSELGIGCTGSAGTPALAGVPFELPWVGGTLQGTLTNLPPGNATSVVTGGSLTQWGAISLPFDLTLVGMTGCTLYTGGEAILPVANPAGLASFSIPIPADPALVGRSFYNQGLVVDPSANPLGLITSNAACAHIGAR